MLGWKSFHFSFIIISFPCAEFYFGRFFCFKDVIPLSFGLHSFWKEVCFNKCFFFFLATFKILSLIFSNINMMCQHVYVCVCIILHEIHWDSWIFWCDVLHYFMKIYGHYFIKHFFCPISSLLSFWEFSYTYARRFDIVS